MLASSCWLLCSMSRVRKRAKWREHGPSEVQLDVARVANLRGVSNASLASIVGVLRANRPLLEQGLGAPQLKDATDAFFTHLQQTETLQLEDGTEFEWQCASLVKSLEFFTKRSANFHELIAAVHAKWPSSFDRPWHLIVYCDEAVPGAVLRLDNKRKLVCFYVSVREMGPKILKHEAAWLPIALLRSCILKDVEGKLSAAARLLLRRQLVEPDGIRLRGALIDRLNGGEPGIIFAKLGNLLYDGDAYRGLLGTKGLNGLFPCVGCKNVAFLHQQTEPEFALHRHDATLALVDVGCSDPRLFDASTSDEIYFKADVLEALRPRVNVGQFQDQEKFSGLNYSASGLLWDRQLRPHVPIREVHTYDATHTFYCDGLVQLEMTLCLKSVTSLPGIEFGTVRDFMSANWRFCKALGGRRAPTILSGIFSKSREKHFKRNGDFSGMASEMLSVVGPFRCFLEINEGIVRERPAVVRSFAALARVVGLLQRAKDGERVGDELAVALYDHAQVFHAAYGAAEGFRYPPKWHVARHIPSQIHRDGFLIDCFVCERYHTFIKLAADSVRNTVQFEKSVLGRALVAHLRLLNEPYCFRDGLLDSEPCAQLADMAGAREASVSRSMRWCGTLILEGDLLRLDGHVRFVEACANVDGTMCLLALPCHFVEQVGAGTNALPSQLASAR